MGVNKRKNPEIAFGFVGLPCAGKGVAIDYLVKDYGFYYASLSDQIREEVNRRGEGIAGEIAGGWG